LQAPVLSNGTNKLIRRDETKRDGEELCAHVGSWKPEKSPHFETRKLLREGERENP
jgi:hypothetical protein